MGSRQAPVKEKTVSQLPGTASRNVPKSVIVLTARLLART